MLCGYFTNTENSSNNLPVTNNSETINSESFSCEVFLDKMDFEKFKEFSKEEKQCFIDYVEDYVIGYEFDGDYSLPGDKEKIIDASFISEDGYIFINEDGYLPILYLSFKVTTDKDSEAHTCAFEIQDTYEEIEIELYYLTTRDSNSKYIMDQIRIGRDLYISHEDAMQVYLRKWFETADAYYFMDSVAFDETKFLNLLKNEIQEDVLKDNQLLEDVVTMDSSPHFVRGKDRIIAIYEVILSDKEHHYIGVECPVRNDDFSYYLDYKILKMNSKYYFDSEETVLNSVGLTFRKK